MAEARNHRAARQRIHRADDRDDDVPSDAPAGQPVRPASSGRRLRVLVVDDEPLIATTLQLLLDEHEVRSIGSGVEARDLFHSGAAFDLILCDLALGDLDAIELSAWLEGHRPELLPRLVIMTGGATSPEGDAFLRRLPPGRRLDKPFPTSAVLRIVTQLQAALDR